MDYTASSHRARPLSPAAHAVADYATAGVFLALAARLRRRHPRAAWLAFAQGAGIIATSMLTDYPGGLMRVLSFRAHGRMDVAATALTAAGPALLGFGRDPEARWFMSLAAAEAGVIAATNFDGDGVGSIEPIGASIGSGPDEEAGALLSM